MQMETRPLYLNKDERLIHALKNAKLDFIPTNVVLDKTLPGVGATYTEIHAKRNSIIIEPNVPVIKGKEKMHPELNILGVYKGVTTKKVEKYLLNSSIKYKKLITTPEGFWKISNAATSCKIDLYSEFFCLFDECERITQDVGFRKNISNPVKDFFKFKSKAFVSATPLDIHHNDIDNQLFNRLKIVPQYNYKEDIQLIVTNDVVSILREKLAELIDSKCVCIFFNSTTGIGSIVQSLGLTDSKIFCSEEGKKKLQDLNLKNIEVDFKLPLAKVNFYTSRFFSAVDIELSSNPDIIIYTDLKQAEHTALDPFSEVIQIQGRFRKSKGSQRFNTLTHISNFNGGMNVKTIEELDLEIDFYRSHYDFLKEKHKETKSKSLASAIGNEIKNIAYYRLLDDEGKLDEFAVHNLYNEERVRSYYLNTESLREAYLCTQFFNVDFRKELRFNLEEERLKMKTESKREKIIRLVSLLQEVTDIEELRKAVLKDFKETNLIIDAFKHLGVNYILQIDYNVSKIKKMMDKYEDLKKRFWPEILLEIFKSFVLNKKQSKNLYKESLQQIYSRYGIKKNATQETIKDYFEVSTNNSLKPSTFTLVSFKFAQSISTINFNDTDNALLN